MLAAGREATNLFDSYHPFTASPQKYLDSMLVRSFNVYTW